ncbi:SURF1 family protein [Photobacterium malacitanum]|uniref:SURF1-like protein n=1 Tax=Photobacterium malacitanum TaxID=2204294 RepID=A0A1Y6MKW8_9GAMM|nr:SURF1 family protein [Photobacterium malacitanum]SMY37072.1 SURF1 family protein [Photobacterium malacitanum]
MMRSIAFIMFTIAVVALLLKLGWWQMSRANEKQQLQSQVTTRQQTMLVDLANLPLQPLWHSITIEGEFDNSRPILLDNQLYRGRPGYHLYLPFVSQQQRVLVNLGWIAAPPYRNILPTLPTFDGRQIITGVVAPAQQLLQFKPDNADNQWPLRVQNIELIWLTQQLQQPLLPWIIQISPSSPIALTQTWQPVVMGPKKHYGYAMQWFLLAIAVVFMSLLWLRREQAV